MARRWRRRRAWCLRACMQACLVCIVWCVLCCVLCVVLCFMRGRDPLKSYEVQSCFHASGLPEQWLAGGVCKAARSERRGERHARSGLRAHPNVLLASPPVPRPRPLLHSVVHPTATSLNCNTAGLHTCVPMCCFSMRDHLHACACVRCVSRARELCVRVRVCLHPCDFLGPFSASQVCAAGRGSDVKSR